MLTNGVVLHHHDSARPHMTAATIETIRKLKLGLLPHPAHSPDLAPSDYHIFRLLKNALRGRHFANDEEVKDVVYTWLHAQPKTFCVDGKRKLFDRSRKCEKTLGDYAEI